MKRWRGIEVMAVIRWLFLMLVLITPVSIDASETTAHHVGEIDQQALFAEYPIFNANYQAYKLSAGSVASFKASLPEALEVRVLFGTWCHDSEREVPRLLKLLNLAGIPDESVELYALDLKKKDPRGMANTMGISYTPTFIFNVGGTEVGRIVERPEESLISDIARLAN